MTGFKTAVSADLKALIERAGYVAYANDHAFSGKIGAAVVAVNLKVNISPINDDWVRKWGRTQLVGKKGKRSDCSAVFATKS